MLARTAIVLLSVLGSLLSGADALANGRPPITNGIYVTASDPTSLYVRSTFGLLISHDDGCTFTWHCEGNVGYGGTYDPQYAIASDGTLYATTPTGLRVSVDRGCSFATSASAPQGNIGALAVAADDTVWVGTADILLPSGLYRSRGRGGAFEASYLPSSSTQWISIATAPSDAARIYATGLDGTSATFVTSNDGGATWTPSALTSVVVDSAPSLRVVAVDPTMPDTLFLASNVVTTGHLYRSTDAGATFTEVLQTAAPIQAVAITSSAVVVAADTSSYRSQDAGLTFTPLTTPRMTCLTALPNGTLVGCGANWDPDFMAVTRSSDMGTSWEKVWRFVELAGPAQCAETTPERTECDSLWPTLRAQFGATGPTCGANQGDRPAAPPKSGCCSASPDGSGWLFAVVLALWWRRRR